MMALDIPTEAHVNDLITTVGQLVEVMDQEVQLLRAMRARDIAELQGRKTPLIDAYERLVATIKSDQAVLETLDPLLRDELRDVMERLQAAVRENETALRATTKANDKLLKTIIEAIQQQQVQRTGYGSLGGMPVRSGAAPVSVQINRQL